MIALTSTISSMSEMEKADRCISDIARDGGHAALEQLYLCTKDSVYGYALSILKNTHDAEDVLHDCYISVYQTAHSYVSAGKPMAWIFTITRNLCLSKIRSRSRFADVPEEDWERYIENNVKEEQLAYKMRIHDSLGQCVTTVSHIMQDTGDVQASAKLWAEAVAGLRTYEDNINAEENVGQRAFREQLSLLEQLGCTVKHEGPLPSRTLHAQIFRDAIRTAAINAVRHANANILFVETKRDNAAFDISITDNGNVRTEHLTEGGGLSSLRKEVESADGEMKITTEKNVKIYIHLPPWKK